MSKSFLRYPGGKSRHTERILQYFRRYENDYREPFLGGGSVFLASEFGSGWLNDIDHGIYDLWRMVRDEPQVLTDIFTEHTPILQHNREPKRIEKAMSLWRGIKDESVSVPRGYRTLFLNKTCFSGVLSGGPIGGVKQTGKHTLASRWAKDTTVRIESAHHRLQNCRITCLSWEDLVEDGHQVCYYFDPPYLVKGGQCYNHAFTLEDHKKFAEVVSVLPNRYVVTVDDCDDLREIWSALVPEHLILSEQWLYSMTDHRDENRVGKEMFIVDGESFNRRLRYKSMKEYQ